MMLFNITLINNFSICYSILIVRNKVIFYQQRIRLIICTGVSILFEQPRKNSCIFIN